MMTQFSKPSKRIIFLLVISGLCLLLVILAVQSHTLRRWLDNVLYDNQGHYLTCEQLPELAEVEAVLAEHQDLIRAIEAVHPGHIGVDLDTSCPGKGSLIIWYASHADREQIEAILDSGTFFGIPYSLNNR